MSEYAKLDYFQSRTIWISSAQLFYTIMAMIPFYYYLRNLISIPNEGRTLLFILPFAVAVLLYLMELRMNAYFWKGEKVYKNRDILVVASKSAILIVSSFYIFFLFMFGYWLSDTEVYGGVSYQTVEGKLMTEVILSMVLIYFLVTMLINIQGSRFESNVMRRIRRS